MKNTYLSPVVRIMAFEETDVITNSGGNGTWSADQMEYYRSDVEW